MSGTTIGLRLLFGISFSWVIAQAAENALSRDEAEGRELAAELCALQPAANATNSAVLVVRDSSGRRTLTPLTITTEPGADAAAGWTTTYSARPAAPAPAESLTILQHPNRAPAYIQDGGGRASPEVLPAGKSFIAFAGSDFWLADLGLEFLHWVDQRILPGPRGDPPMVKGRSCKVLESRAPAGAPYSRVVSWVDNEFKSIIQADAYALDGKLLKRFSVGSFKKVGGVWQLKDMEMIDERRDTKTKLEFELQVRER
ncbi:MAG TPA: outer membrane lipoprotein-sorting protein [Verrucomicrobiota bacterium]|nr:hypothetical protein [Verrucomicrobiales bacterium]HRI13607.1 outer membrane lipoprotein-sorting protein [Verrucomicrobiota bacterium]